MPTINVLFSENEYLKNLKSICFILLGAMIFLLPFLFMWNGSSIFTTSPQYSYYCTLLGTLPYSDAGGYYHGAMKYLNTGLLSEWNLRRPIHTLLLSSELFLMRGNFWYAMILHVFTCGLSCALASYTTIKNLNKTAGVIFIITIFWMSIIFIPTTLTETTGIIFGSLAFIFLWIGYIKRQTFTFSFGIFILTLALHARAGAFLVLPCMTLLAMVDFTKTTVVRLRILAYSCIAIITATCVVILTQKIYGEIKFAQVHANFSYVVFGLVSGGKGWTFALSLPGISVCKDESEVAMFLYKESFKVFVHNPFLLILGILKNLEVFIKYHLNCTLPDSLVISSGWLKILVRTLGFSFFSFCFYTLKRAYNSIYFHRMVKFILAGFVGIILSVLIIGQDGGIRVFAATYTFWGLALGIVASFYKQKNIEQVSFNVANDKTILYIKVIATLFACYCLFLSIILPSYIRLQKSNDFSNVFLDNNIAIVVNVKKNPYMVVYPKEDNFVNYGFKEITKKRYENFLKKLDGEIPKQFLNIANEQYFARPFVVFCTTDLINHNRYLYVLSSLDVLQTSAPFLRLVGVKKNNVFVVKSYQPIVSK